MEVSQFLKNSKNGISEKFQQKIKILKFRENSKNQNFKISRK